MSRGCPKSELRQWCQGLREYRGINPLLHLSATLIDKGFELPSSQKRAVRIGWINANFEQAGVVDPVRIENVDSNF